VALREILASLGVEVDDRQLDAFEVRLSGVVDKLKRLTGAFVARGLAKAFKGFLEDQAEAGFQLGRTAEMVGLSTEALQRWRHSADLAGESTAKFDRAMRFVLKNVGSAELGMTAAGKQMRRWGIDIYEAGTKKVKPVGDLLFEFSDLLKAMPSQAKRTAMAIQTFGVAGAQVLPWLQQGSDAIKAQLADYEALGGGMSHEYVESAAKAARQTRRLHLAMITLKAGIAQGLMPMFERSQKRLAEFVGHMGVVIRQSNAVQVALRFLAATAGVVVVYQMVKGAQAVIALARAMGFLKAAASIGSLLGWGALIAAFVGLYLVIEDLSVAIEGGDSLLRKWLDDSFGIEETDKILTELLGTWRALVDPIKLSTEEGSKGLSNMGWAAKGLITTLELIMVAVDLLLAGFRALGNVLIGDFKAAGEIIDKTGDKLLSVFKNSKLAKLTGTNPEGTLFDASGAPVAPGTPAWAKLNEEKDAWLARTDPQAFHNQVYQGVPQSAPGPWQGPQMQSHVETHIVINDAQDPKKVGKEVAERITGLVSENHETMMSVGDE
jgi:hypothetical protein